MSEGPSPRGAGLDIEPRLEGDVATLELTGELGLDTGASFRAASLTALAARPTELVVDMLAADFLDSSGLAALLDLAAAAEDSDVELSVRCTAGGAARRTIEATGTGVRLGLV